MKTAPLPGSRWFRWVSNLTLRVGVLTGVYLTTVMVLSVLAATRLAILEPVADLRNGVSYASFVFVSLVPVVCFLRSPMKMFVSAMCGWSILTVNYALMGVFFSNLHAGLGKTPFHLFVLGAAVYGVTAVALWVASMVASMREHPIAASRRRL